MKYIGTFANLELRKVSVSLVSTGRTALAVCSASDLFRKSSICFTSFEICSRYAKSCNLCKIGHVCALNLHV